jgi:hypothetical protein
MTHHKQDQIITSCWKWNTSAFQFKNKYTKSFEASTLWCAGSQSRHNEIPKMVWHHNNGHSSDNKIPILYSRTSLPLTTIMFFCPIQVK